MKYLLDPDYRKLAPKDKPFCIRCQKPLDNISQAVKVTPHYDTMEVSIGGTELMGKDCWKRITKTQGAI